MLVSRLETSNASPLCTNYTCRRAAPCIHSYLYTVNGGPRSWGGSVIPPDVIAYYSKFCAMSAIPDRSEGNKAKKVASRIDAYVCMLNAMYDVQFLDLLIDWR